MISIMNGRLRAMVLVDMKLSTDQSPTKLVGLFIC